MLLQFSVENYKSFKDSTILSLEASCDKEHLNNVTNVGKDRCLNVVTIFGANAAGKSNLFLALNSSISLIRRSNDRQVTDELSEIIPFKFDSDCLNKPSKFEYVFYKDNTKYVYGFSATTKEIVDEYLYVYKTQKATLVFERKNTNVYRFTSKPIEKELLPLTEMNTANKLFLATATAWNAKTTRAAYEWFDSLINTYSNDASELLLVSSKMLESDNDGSLKYFTKRLLNEADINVEDYEIEIEERNKRYPLVKINTIHKIKKDGQDNIYYLSFEEESKGTMNTFLFSPIFKRAFERGETVCIDEFDMSLHPMLVKYLVSLFNDSEVNKNHAQLIISTHTLELLSLDDLRRDQIYFIEKDNETGVSLLYSLDEFSPRKNEKVKNAYLLGRYGAIPFISAGNKL